MPNHQHYSNLQDAKKKQEMLDAKKAEVRKRLEEQSAKKQKKGFMTPDRKKKLRVSIKHGQITSINVIFFILCSCFCVRKLLKSLRKSRKERLLLEGASLTNVAANPRTLMEPTKVSNSASKVV